MNDDVLVVSGLPRSGTSLAMALLGAGGLPLLTDAVRRPDPDNPLGYLEYEPVRRLPRDASWLAGARGRAVKIVIPLLRSLPDGLPCRVVVMRRDIREVVASQERMLVRRGAPAGRLAPERLAGVLDAMREESLAWLRSRPATSWIEIAHRALVHGPGDELERLAAFAGLRVPTATLAAVIRRDLHRERAPETEGPAARATGPSRVFGR